MEFVHDRWPCFRTTTKTEELDVTIQYVVSKQTVYQNYLFQQKSNGRAPEIPALIIKAGLLIRDLDFSADPDENNRHSGHPNYSDHAPLSSRHLIRLHKGARTKPDDGRDIALVISPFVGDRALDLIRIGESSDYRINLDEQASNRFANAKQLDITLAYTLQLIRPDKVGRRPSPVSQRDVVTAKEKLTKAHFRRLGFAEDEHLNFVLGRNLEHILSVCSIPVVDRSSENQRDKYACDQYVCKLRARIWRVCRGHLKWLFETTERPDRLFSPHYWATGKPIADWEDSPWLSSNPLIDTPLQIIKLGEFFVATKDEEVRDYASKKLEDCIEPWLRQTLETTNRNGQYAFPRSFEGEIPNYYFVDHAVIWRAARSLEELGLESRLLLKIVPPPEEGSKTRSYSSNEIQKNILKRFTTENSVTRKRMIAVSRSASETRFLFHSKDTMLFYGMEMGLFDELSMTKGNQDDWENKIDVWRNTVDCQMHHEHNNEKPWFNPLRYALSMVMAATGKRMKTQPDAEIHKLSKSILLKGSSPNGLFEGRLNDNKDPVKFDSEIWRDSWWSVTFEIPYTIWSYGLLKDQTTASSTEHSKQDTASQASNEVSRVLENILERIAAAPKESTTRETVAMKSSMPFNNVIDQKNIVDLSDEWLYNEPKFFDPKSQYDISDEGIEEFCKEHEEICIGRIIDAATKKVIERLKQKQDENVTSMETTSSISTPLSDIGFVADIPRTKRSKSNDAIRPSSSWHGAIRHALRAKRTPEVAKKRFVWLYRADDWTALICYLASSERDEISHFYDKHATYEKHFFEETTAVLNKWVTELHLSFYQILDRDPKDLPGLPKADGTRFPSSGEDMGEGNKAKWIGRASMSFRFDGDFFDRYWTCHFLEYNPRHFLEEPTPRRRCLDDVREKAMMKSVTSARKEPWRQRRVLELVLFDRILQEMIISTTQILKETKGRVLKVYTYANGSENEASASSDGRASTLLDALNLFSEINNDLFLSTSREWQQFQQVLQVVEEDLDENLAKIKIWLDRERERESERPRWTRNDERRYRGTISKLLVQNNHKIQELRHSHASIMSFNASLTRRLEVMRSDLELRGADDIRLFTYVTVVFLPVGFATGIFSMSNAPTTETLVKMIITAAVALAATVIALINAKVLEEAFLGPIIRITSLLVHLIVDPVYRFLIYPFVVYLVSPCIYFSVRYLISPIQNWLSPGKTTLPPLVAKFLDRIGRLHPIKKAQDDYKKELAKKRTTTRERSEDKPKAGLKQLLKGFKGGTNRNTHDPES
ncbi:hypothetical protein SLS58_007837 [Diplodia intermedia]|uniref:Mg2+ transporter zinc transport protein n=1 Tax=Diplodia intermedia TaxID=856260 RepID=A0ABR3TJ50_9PEZI